MEGRRVSTKKRVVKRATNLGIQNETLIPTTDYPLELPMMKEKQLFL